MPQLSHNPGSKLGPPAAKPSSLASRLAGAKLPGKRAATLWEGPESLGRMGGVTQSLLNDWISDRERTRLRLVEGYQAPDKFSHYLEYGQFFHLACESLAAGRDWSMALKQYTVKLCRKYRTQQEEVLKWHSLAQAVFPEYAKYQAKHWSKIPVKPLMQEQVFHLPYQLPNGCTVYLRGKWDGVDLVGKPKAAGVYLFESKTKGDIDEQRLQRQITFDLQTGFYMVALTLINSDTNIPQQSWARGLPGDNTIRGVRYNVVRRPLSGGRGSIVRHKAKGTKPEETMAEFCARLIDDYVKPEPEYWFMRWQVEVTPGDLLKFRRQFLDPLLTELCEWWDWIKADPRDPWREGNRLHFRTAYGTYNSLQEQGFTDMDTLLDTGVDNGLVRAESLFTELE